MPTLSLDTLVMDMDKLNMAVMVNLSGRGRGDDAHLINSLSNVKENQPHRFIVFTNILRADIYLLTDDDVFDNNDITLKLGEGDQPLQIEEANADKLKGYKPSPFWGVDLGPVFVGDDLQPGWESLPEDPFEPSDDPLVLNVTIIESVPTSPSLSVTCNWNSKDPVFCELKDACD